MDSPVVTFRCETYHQDTLTVEKLDETGIVYLEMTDGDTVGDFLSFNLSPEDALALGAHLIQLAQENGQVTPDVLSSYGHALQLDAIKTVNDASLGCG
jgi:hypothetical protein